MLSAHDDEEYAIALLGEGHSGLAYLLKDRIAQGDELVRAIREVHAGGSVVDPAIAERLTGSRHVDDEDRQMLDMMSKGLGYAEMAAALDTTQEAVDRRVTELFQRIASGGAGGADDFRRLHAAVVESAQPMDASRRRAGTGGGRPAIEPRSRSSASSRSLSCSAISAGSRRCPNGWGRAISPT